MPNNGKPRDEKNYDEDDNEIKFYGNYRGLVLSDLDPRDIGRVKVSVPGVFHEDLKVDDLPWAIPATGIYRSGGANMAEDDKKSRKIESLTQFNEAGTGGVFSVPNIGSHVWVWFDKGNWLKPVYFACAPGEGDWLFQKEAVKKKLKQKIDAVAELKTHFFPENNVAQGKRIGAKAAVNTKQGLEGQKEAGTGLLAGSRRNEITASKTDSDEKKTYTPGTAYQLEIKEQADKQKNGDTAAISTRSIDKVEETGKNINRYMTSLMTRGGTSLFIDNRDDQENFYMLHKNYLFNLDEHGNRNVMVGQGKNQDQQVRCDDSLAIAGDWRRHVWGDIITHVGGNINTQCDRNLQLDINETMGIRIVKGDFDIIIEGNQEANDRDKNESSRDEGKPKANGDLNISIKGGNFNFDVEGDAFINVEGNCDQKVQGDYTQYVKGEYNLIVGGNMIGKVGGNYEWDIGGTGDDKKRCGFSVNGDFKVAASNAFTVSGTKYSSIYSGEYLGIGSGGKVGLAAGGSIVMTSAKNQIKVQEELSMFVSSTGEASSATSKILLTSSKLATDVDTFTCTGEVKIGKALVVGDKIEAGGDIVSGSGVSMEDHKHFSQDVYAGPGLFTPNFTKEALPASAPSITAPEEVKIEDIPGVLADLVISIGGYYARKVFLKFS